MAQTPQASRREKQSETSIGDAVRPARRASGRAWLLENPWRHVRVTAQPDRDSWPDRNKYGRDSARRPAAAWRFGQVSQMLAAIAHFYEMIGKVASEVRLSTRSGGPRLRVAGVPVREQIGKNDGQNASQKNAVESAGTA